MDAYIGEIRTWPIIKCPNNWHFCDGSLLQINEYQALYSLIGTTYGGNGTTTFALPDLRNRVPIHNGQGTNMTMRNLGSTGGTTAETLTQAQIPAHVHTMTVANVEATTTTPGPTVVLAATSTGSGLAYYETTGFGETVVSLNPTTVTSTGGGQAHSNLMPTISMNYIICLVGNYPTQS